MLWFHGRIKWKCHSKLNYAQALLHCAHTKKYFRVNLHDSGAFLLASGWIVDHRNLVLHTNSSKDRWMMLFVIAVSSQVECIKSVIVLHLFRIASFLGFIQTTSNLMLMSFLHASFTFDCIFWFRIPTMPEYCNRDGTPPHSCSLPIWFYFTWAFSIAKSKELDTLVTAKAAWIYSLG